MAYTQADADNLKAAIATGARDIQYSDGSRVQYRTLAEMKEALSMINAEVSPTAKTIRAFRGGYIKSGY